MPYNWPFDEGEAPKEKGFLEELGDAAALAGQLGRGLLDLPGEVSAGIAGTRQGTDVPAPGTVTPEETKIRSAEEASKRRLSEAPKEGAFGVSPQDIESVIKSTGGSISNLAAGAAGAIPGAAVGGPVGALVGGGAASFYAGKRLDENQLLREIRDAANEEYFARRGIGLSEHEWNDLKTKVESNVNLHGLAESIPETAGDLVTIGIALSPLGRVPGMSNLAARLATKMAGAQATELATETATRQLQQPTEAELGLTQEAPRELTSFEDWAKSFREVAAPTAIQTLMLGGGEVAAGEMINAMRRQEAVMDTLPSEPQPHASIEPSAEPATERDFLMELTPPAAPLSEESLLTFKDVIAGRSRDEYTGDVNKAALEGEVIQPWPKFQGSTHLSPEFTATMWTAAETHPDLITHGDSTFILGKGFGPRVQQKVMNRAEEVIRRFLPSGTKIVISDSSLERSADVQLKHPWIKNRLDQSNGWMSQLETGHYYISVNVPKTNLDDVQIASTLEHELGHIIQFANIKKAPLRVLEQLNTDYVSWAASRLDLPLRDVIKSRWNARSAFNMEEWLKGYEPTLLDYKVRDILKHPNWDIGKWGSSAIRPEYLLSPEEWMAESFVRWSQHPQHGLNDLGRFWKHLGAIMEQFYTAKGDKAAQAERLKTFAPRAGYITFINNFDADRLKKAVRGDSSRTVGDTIADTISNVSSKGPPADQTTPALSAGRINGEIDKWNKMMELFYTVPQIADLNPHIGPLQVYVKELEAMAATKNKILHRAQDIFLAWNRLLKGRANNVAKFLLEETVGSVPLNLNDKAVLTKYGLDSESVQVIERIKKDLLDTIETFERTLTAHIIDELKNNPVAMQAEVNRLHAEMQKLKAKPFFPLARFGNYTVVVEAKKDFMLQGKMIKAGTVFDMRTFENEIKQKNGLKEAEDDYAQQVQSGEVSIGRDFIEDVVFEFQGVPPQVFERLEQDLTLTPQQLQQLKELKVDLLPGKSYLKHMQKRRGVLGFSEDGPRAYTAYMLRAANHLARLQHYKQLSQSVVQVADSASAIRRAGADAVKRRKIHQYMAETYKYVMNPGNDWAGLRSAAFQWFIGLNPKQALVNLVQIPLATYPELATAFGDAKAVAAITKAGVMAKDVLANPKKVPSLIQQALMKATDSGLIEQTFASTVAAVAEGGVLSRALPGNQAARLFRQMGFISAYMFSMTEKFNRQVSFIAAFDLATKRGDTFDQAYDYARKVVQRTQGEYSKWARPKIMRGKKGAFFIFKSYTQFMLYFLLHNPARVRMMMMLMLLGGLSALPFAEDLFDVVDYALSRGGKKFSSRKELMKLAQEYLGEIGIKPELALHGIAHESFGWSYFGDHMGVPIPRVDLSRSVSMGRVVPGIEGLNYPSDNFLERLGRTGADVAGAGLGIPLTVAKVISEYDRYPDKARALEDILPTWAKSIAKGYRFMTEGAVQDRQLRSLIEFDPVNPEHRMEVLATTLGFTPTRLTEKYDQIEMQRQHVMYYQARRESLLHDFAIAKISDDREAAADARAAVHKYNSEVPDRKLRISSRDLQVSLRRRLRNIAKFNKNLPLEGQRYRGLFKEIDDVFTSDEEVIEREIRNLENVPVDPLPP